MIICVGHEKDVFCNCCHKRRKVVYLVAPSYTSRNYPANASYLSYDTYFCHSEIIKLCRHYYARDKRLVLDGHRYIGATVNF